MRYAKGLAAFDELAPPTTFGLELKTQRANELTFGLSGNVDLKFGNMMVGALSRRFIDADENSNDPDDGWEYAVDARPLFRVIPDWFVGADLSYQARFPRGINPLTLKAEDASVFQIAPMLVFSPLGPSSTTARRSGSSIGALTSTTARATSTCPRIRGTATSGSTSSASRPSGGSTRRPITDPAGMY